MHSATKICKILRTNNRTSYLKYHLERMRSHSNNYASYFVQIMFININSTRDLAPYYNINTRHKKVANSIVNHRLFPPFSQAPNHNPAACHIMPSHDKPGNYGRPSQGLPTTDHVLYNVRCSSVIILGGDNYFIVALNTCLPFMEDYCSRSSDC